MAYTDFGSSTAVAREQAEREAQQKAQNDARTAVRNRMLVLDDEAYALMERCDIPYQRCGLGRAPEPMPGETRDDYGRRMIAAMKPVTGFKKESSEITNVPLVLNSLLDDVEKHWRRPADLRPGQSRQVTIRHGDGFEERYEVFGRGSRPFRQVFGAYLPATETIGVFTPTADKDFQ